MVQDGASQVRNREDSATAQGSVQSDDVDVSCAGGREAATAIASVVRQGSARNRNRRRLYYVPATAEEGVVVGVMVVGVGVGWIASRQTASTCDA
jgi:hypothetical protein